MKTTRRRAAAAACATLALALLLPGAADAGCLDGTTMACVDWDGCPGRRMCEGGRWSECVGICEQEPGEPALDTFIALNSPSATDVGICVDGWDANGAVNDKGYVLPGTGSATTFTVGELTWSSSSREVLAFAVDRSPTWVSTPWTASADVFTRAIDGEATIPITVWIVQGPFENEMAQAASSAAGAAALLRRERTGVGYSSITLTDATQYPNAPNALNVAGGSYGALVNGIGFDAGRINIYWVGTVNGGTGGGLSWDGTPVIAVGHNTAPGIFAHELGHAFVLDHTDAQPGFDGTNIMASAATNRQFLTEGQNFRVHFHPSSMLNALYHVRPNKPSRSCSSDTASSICPRNDKRLWADGVFPAN